MTEESLLQFPCWFMIKIMGIYSKEFYSQIYGILLKHFPQITLDQVTTNFSRNQKYLAISVNLYVNNKPELDAVYQELTKHPKVKMVL